MSFTICNFDKSRPPKTIQGFKSLAKKHRKATGIKYVTALDEVARYFGWMNFSQARAELDVRDQ